jgi:formylglycine-generating enzyme required for sulfatase activity
MQVIKAGIIDYMLLSISFVVILSAGGSQELKLPTPNGDEMIFVPVCVNKDSDSISWKNIKLGDPSGEFKEKSMSTALGGSFPLKQNGVKYWCYYMGKYEVTTRQYNSIINGELAKKRTNKDQYPIVNISWNDALNFSDKYNQWLFANFKDRLPKYDKSYGFLRLPTEEEWEFAARGASSVTAKQFKQKIPYPNGKLHEYEWFGGPTSSHYKLQKVGKLKPNPIGLHDMLGNVSEMTMSLFKVGYNQGPTGGFVVKGNNYNTSKKKLRSSYRSEQPFYRQHSSGMLMPHTQKTLGFRLVISAILFPSRKAEKKISSNWSKYNSKSVDKNHNKTTQIIDLDAIQIDQNYTKISDDLFLYIARVAKSQKSLLDHEKIYISIRDIINPNINKSYMMIKMASKLIISIQKSDRVYISTKYLKDISEGTRQNRSVKIDKDTLFYMRNNIDNALSSYLYILKQLNNNSVISIKKGLVRYKFFLKRHHNNIEIPILFIIKKHIFELKKGEKMDIKRLEKDILE